MATDPDRLQGYLNTSEQCDGQIQGWFHVAGTAAANGCTANLNPIALRMADKLLSAGLPFRERVR